MITPYNDYTKTNEINLGSEQGRLAKLILKKHTSHPDNIRALLESGNPNRIRKYMDNELEKNELKIVSFIEELKREGAQRQAMLEQISKVSNFSKVHSLKKRGDKAKQISAKIWGNVIKTLHDTENNHKKTLLILANEIYKIGGLKNKVQRKQKILSNLEQKGNDRPQTLQELLIKKRNLKVNIKKLRTRANDIKRLNEAARQNEELIDKLHKMLIPIAKKQNLRIDIEDNNEKNEKYTNKYKSIFKNEMKLK